MNVNIKQLVMALTAMVVFAQTGVTQLNVLEEDYKSIAVFVLGALAVFLQTFTSGEGSLTLRRRKS